MDVVATVNYATEKASARYRDTVTPGDLVTTVEHAVPPRRTAGDGRGGTGSARSLYGYRRAQRPAPADSSSVAVSPAAGTG